ncbi:SusC/RagA family TonB-linked outer membrane protein [soil metagenome]
MQKSLQFQGAGGPILKWIVMVVFSLMLTSMVQAQQTVSGKVTSSEDKSSMPGANVVVKGTSNGTITDAEGNYSVTLAPGQDVLVFSFVGFISQEIAVGGRSIVDVVLPTDSKQLSEIVVTALGIEKDKSKIGYATQEVRGDALNKARDPNPIGNLVGKVAGLTVASSPELLGSPNLYLRGKEPLFVVDGVPIQSDTWNISPDDIEKYTILKGPAASALYGSRGQYGAIQITTKRGSKDSRGFSVDFNTSTTVESGFLAIPKVQNLYGPGDHGSYAFGDGKGAGLNDSDYDIWGPRFDGQLIPQYDGIVDPSKTYTTNFPNGASFTGNIIPTPWVARGVDNLQKFLQNGVLTTNNIAVSTSGENYDLRFSTSYNYQKGLVPTTQLSSNNFNVSAGIDFSPKVRFETTVNYNKQYTDNIPDVTYGPNSMIYNIIIWGGADWSMDDMKRDIYQTGKEGIQQKYADYTRYNNPWFLAQNWTRGHYKTDIYGQMSLKWKIMESLELVGRTQINTYDILRTEKFPYSATTYGREQARGDYREDKRTMFENNTDFLLTFRKDLTPDFNLTASLGGNVRTFNYHSSYTTTDYLNVPGWFSFQNSSNPIKAYNFDAPMSVYSWYGYVDLSYKKYVNLSLTGRQDKHSTLPEKNNQYFYPSASLSLLVSQMVELPAAFSYLQLRGSYARVGGGLTSSSIGPIPSISLTGNPLGYGSTYQSPYGGPSYVNSPTYDAQLRYNNTPAAYFSNTITNPDLKPSFSSAWEVGTDMRFLQSRIGVDVTYFQSLDGPGIYNLPISETTGYNTALVNGITTLRKGWEVVLNANPVSTESGFKWNVMVNWSTYKETIESIYGDIQNLDAFRQVGERVDQIWGTALLKKNDGTLIIGSDGRAIPLTSYNGSSRRFLGNWNPDWTYGITNTFSYKNVSLSFQLDGRVGGVIEDYIQKQTFRGGRHIETIEGAIGLAREQDLIGVKSYVGSGVNITGGVPKVDNEGRITNENELTFNSANANKTYAQDWISRYYNTSESNMISRTFSKIREVIITYNFPSTVLSKTFIKKASVSLIGRNLFYFAEKKDMDIEQYGGPRDPIQTDGGGGLQTPTTRRYGVNLNITF